MAVLPTEFVPAPPWIEVLLRLSEFEAAVLCAGVAVAPGAGFATCRDLLCGSLNLETSNWLVCPLPVCCMFCPWLAIAKRGLMLLWISTDA